MQGFNDDAQDRHEQNLATICVFIIITLSANLAVIAPDVPL